MRRLILSLLICLPFACAGGADGPSARSNAMVADAQTGPSAPPMLDRAAALKSAADVSLKKFPDADTVLVDDFTRVTYQADGTDVAWDDAYTKILTEKGRQEQQAVTLNYNLFYDTATVVRVEVIKPDGKAQDVDIAAQSQTMVDRGQMQMNIYDPNDRVVQVGIPDVDIGDVVHAITVHRTKKTRMPDTWNDFQVFESMAPIKRYTYEVNAPTARPLSRIELKDAVPGTVSSAVSTNGDRIVYRWDVRDVPRIFEEPNMPEYYSCVQRLLVSTIPDWQTVSKWYWGISEKHYEATTPDLIAKVHELTDGVKDEREKIQRLFTFVSQQIRYMGITTEKEAPGYEPHDVSITFGQKYGVCRDKAALLVAMLRVAGLKAFPTLIHVGPKKDTEVPMPWFNHAIVSSQTSDGEYVLMDPTDENTSDLMPSYLCDKSYLVARPEGEGLRTAPIVPASNNLLRVATRGKLDEHGTLKLESSMVFEGINDNSYRGYFATISPDERRRFFDSRLGQLLPGAKLTDLAIEPKNLRDTTLPMKVTLACEVPDFEVQSSSHRMIALPWLGHAFGVVNHILGQTGLEKRRFPLRTEIACGVEETIDLELGDSAAPLAVPHVPEISRDDLEFRQDVSISGNHVSGKAAFLLKKVEFPPARYAALKQSLRDIEFAHRQRIVLPQVIAGATNPDAEVLKRTINIVVKDNHEWTTTDEHALKILSYAGKKRLSELKLDYNPIWEELTVTNVTVTGKDGKIHTLATQEINVMDAEWVASAPRYPAAKTLVASLPGVEVGSEIHYTIVHHRRDQPFFSAMATFRDFDPVDSMSLTVTAPKSLAIKQAINGDGFVSSIVTNGDAVTRSWTNSNQPALVREDHLPPLWSFVPSVRLSAGDWKTYAPSIIEPMEKIAKADDAIKKAVKEALKGKHGDFDQATAIRDYVAINVRLAGPSLDQLPTGILTPPSQTLKEGYGNTRDRALLYFAMLKQAGFKPDFILAASHDPLVRRLQNDWLANPQRSAFDTVMVAAEVGKKCDGFFNDTDQYAHLGSTPHLFHAVLKADGGMDSITGESNSEETHESFRLDENGDAVINIETKFTDMKAADFHREMAQQTPEERRRYAQELIAGISQAATLDGEFKVDDSEYPARLSFSVRVRKFAVRERGVLYFTLPNYPQFQMPGASSARVNPLYLQERDKVSIYFEPHFPKGAALVSPSLFYAGLPDDMGNLGLTELHSRSDGKPETGLFEYLVLKPAVVQPDHNDELHELNGRLRNAASRTFLLKLAE